MGSDDDHKPGGSNALKRPVGPVNPEIVEEEQADFEREFEAISGLDVTEYFKFYPDYFRDELRDLYEEKSDAGQGLFFKLNLDVPSPLVWLLLNQPNVFLLACERCIAQFKKMHKDITAGAKQSVHPDEQREIIRIKEEIESYMLELDLKDYQAMLKRRIAALHMQMSQLDTEDERDYFDAEVLQPFMKEYNWLFNDNTLKAIEQRILDLFTTLAALTGLLLEKGLFEVVTFEDDGVKF